MPDSVYTASFQRAALQLGGSAPLALYLGASPATVERWLRGEARPPVVLFLRVVDLLFPHG